MKKTIIAIIVIIVIVLTIVGAIFLFNKNNQNNNVSNKEELITIRDIQSDEGFIYNGLDIDQTNKSIKLYVSKIDNESNIYVYSVNIYDEYDHLLETVYVEDSSINKGYITLKYKNDLSNAFAYNVEIMYAPLVG